MTNLPRFLLLAALALTATGAIARSPTGDDGLEGWSYRPLRRPAVPATSDATWARNPVDAFVLARLDAAGLEPAPPAERVKLLRRATYDLTGLPPTPAEVQAFLDDTQPDAYERLIERLLASPSYGERWGRHWLDVVRYAETNGFERDSDKPHIWRYRDWVIQAFNQDLPYDRFVLEQLAGDELDDVTPGSIVATGFARLMMWDDEPGMGRLQARYDGLDDLVRTTGEAFLGMTVGCARCHDHKGDPISQVDYYSLMAFFHGVSEIRSEGTLVDIQSPEERAALEARRLEHTRALESGTAELSAIEQEFLRLASERGGRSPDLRDLSYRFYRDTWSKLPDFDMLLAEDTGMLEGGLFDLSPATREEAFGFVFEGQLAVPADGVYRFVLDSDDGARLTLGGRPVIERDGTHALGEPQTVDLHLTRGETPARLDFFQWVGGAALQLSWRSLDQDRFRFSFDDPGPGWERPEHDDASWPEGLGGFGTEGTPGAEVGTVWDGPDIWLRREFEWDQDDAAELVLVVHHDEGLEVYLDGVLAAETRGILREYRVLEVNEEARAGIGRGRHTLAVHCQNTGGGQYVHVRPVHRAEVGLEPLADLAFGRRSLSASPLPGPRHDLAQRIQASGADVLGGETLRRYLILQGELGRLRREQPRSVRMANAVTENGSQPEPLFVHLRGNPATPGERVEPRFPTCLNPPPAVLPKPAADAETSGRRRVLAEWIASAENPLTARVMVNRIWQHHFGRGIVPTPNDFGEFGERPTHPELLDWLASEFIASGWSVKHMHRLIMGSNAYQSGYDQGQRIAARAAEMDPENTLLWRFRMRRLSAEELRDSILAMTGLLNMRMGGPSFFSRIPSEALATSSQPNNVWGNSPGAKSLRRSVYIKAKRSMQTPLLANHDLADMDSSCPVRFNTTAPTQALGMLNSDLLHQHAAGFAARLEREAGTGREAQVELALRLALARAPEPGEVREYLAYLTELEHDFELSPSRSLETFCLLVLNLNEFVYLD